jgi:hypothetical protein
MSALTFCSARGSFGSGKIPQAGGGATPRFAVAIVGPEPGRRMSNSRPSIL